MKNILVPTDFSAGAANALAYAYSLADAIQSSIILLHVIEIKMELMDLPIPSGATYQAQKEAAALAMEAQIEFAHSYYPEQKDTMVKIESVIKVGNPISAIKATAAEHESHLIVMGARGKKKSELEKMMGTLSSAVAERANEPVLIVPEGCAFRQIQQVAYASDLLLSDTYQLWSALKIIEPFSPVVRWVHVNKESSEEEIGKGR
ncbi:MAG: universal stress protein [Saprospiraceae bacterium]|nr:universal stress protein [Saprospiraceae bacterium]